MAYKEIAMRRTVFGNGTVIAAGLLVLIPVITCAQPGKGTEPPSATRKGGELPPIVRKITRPASATDIAIQTAGLALIQYAEDNSGKLPPMQNAVVMRKGVGYYASHPESFTDPATGQLFAPNPSLSGQYVWQFVDKPVVLLYSSAPAPDGSRTLLLVPLGANGGPRPNSVVHVPKSRWLAAKRQYGIK